MKDSQILSAYLDLEPQVRPPALARALVFDACHVGVVLRAVLFVEAVMAVGAMFGAATPTDWLTRLALFTGGALPATLVWLIAACGLKSALARLPPRAQYGVGVALGAVAGLCGGAMLASFARQTE